MSLGLLAGACLGGGDGDDDDDDAGIDAGPGEVVVGVPEVDPLDADVAHPISGVFPRLLVDVAWDVDAGQALGLDDVRERIAGAGTYAEENQLSEDRFAGEIYQEPLYDEFHYWPNILDLTEIYYADAALYGDIAGAILALDPDGADVRGDLDADVDDGDRVFLIRDYVSRVAVGERTYSEIHYAFLVNLDDGDVTELRVHDQVARGLADLHDPLVDALREAFAAPDGSGRVWQMCLRGNLQRQRWDAVIVDRIPGPDGDEFWIERVHDECRYLEPDEPPPPYEVVIPPPMQPPPPGGERDPEEDVPGNPKGPPAPLIEDEGGVVPEPPVVPWKWGDRAQEPPDAESPAGSSGTAPANPGCSNDVAKAQQSKDMADQQRAQIGGDINNDIDTHDQTRYGWVSGLTFGNPCLQNLYDSYDAQIAAVDAQIAAKKAELEAIAAEAESAVDGASLAVRTLLAAQAFWDNMIHVGGTWSNITISWTPAPFIPAGGLGNMIIVIGDDLLGTFQRIVVFEMMNGATWDEAVQTALMDERVYPDEQGITPGDPIMQMIWLAYADCLRELYEAQFRDYLSDWLDGASEAEREHAIAVLFDGDGALTPDEAAELMAVRDALAALGADAAACAAMLEALEKEKTRLRLQYRHDARNSCYQQMTSDFWVLFNTSQILQSFLDWCASGMTSWTISYYPADGDNAIMCQALQQLIAQAQAQNCQQLLAFLTMLQQSFGC